VGGSVSPEARRGERAARGRRWAHGGAIPPAMRTLYSGMRSGVHSTLRSKEPATPAAHRPCIADPFARSAAVNVTQALPGYGQRLPVEYTAKRADAIAGLQSGQSAPIGPCTLCLRSSPSTARLKHEESRASGGTADAPALGAGVARRASSNLASPTNPAGAVVGHRLNPTRAWLEDGPRDRGAVD
jgi:hypothetical protein